jgi:hypothetical protein
MLYKSWGGLGAGDMSKSRYLAWVVVEDWRYRRGLRVWYPAFWHAPRLHGAQSEGVESDCVCMSRVGAPELGARVSAI